MLMILGLDLEKQTLNQRRLVGTGQKSSDGEVSEFGILSKKEVISENKNVRIPSPSHQRMLI